MSIVQVVSFRDNKTIIHYHENIRLGAGFESFCGFCVVMRWLLLIYIPSFEQVPITSFVHFVHQLQRIVSGYCKLHGDTTTMHMCHTFHVSFLGKCVYYFHGSVMPKFLWMFPFCAWMYQLVDLFMQKNYIRCGRLASIEDPASEQ